MLDEYDRGATIGFSTPFKDTSGAVFIPPGANLTIAYSVDGVATATTFAMVMADGIASYDWDSAAAQADAGKVDWFATSTGAVKATKRGSFMLGVNAANSVG